jgi:hypothetical protein
VQFLLCFEAIMVAAFPIVRTQEQAKAKEARVEIAVGPVE